MPRLTLEVAPGVPLELVYVPPGQHQLRVWYVYVVPVNVGTTVLTTAEERPSLVVYTTRWNVFLKGKMEVDGMMVAPNGAPLGPGPSAAMMPGGQQVPGMAPQGMAPQGMAGAPGMASQDAAAAANPPAWHPDPTRRHEMRWWDGQAWGPPGP